MTTNFNTIDEALEDIRSGKIIILVDDEDRENEGDLVMAAESVTPEAINFMAKHARGLICVTLTADRTEQLNLHPQTVDNTAPFGTAFTVSIDAARDVTTGISAADRATTIRMAVDLSCKSSDFTKPGHIFPLRAHNGGVLKRAGQTEGSVDLARMAGRYPAGVICEIMNEDGTMARVPDLMEFAKRHAFKLITIKDLIQYRLSRETFVKKSVSAELPTIFGNFEAWVFENELDSGTHIALVKGLIDEAPTLVRVHSGCLTSDRLRLPALRLSRAAPPRHGRY